MYKRKKSFKCTRNFSVCIVSTNEQESMLLLPEIKANKCAGTSCVLVVIIMDIFTPPLHIQLFLRDHGGMG